MRKPLHVIKEEFLKVLPPTIFFFVSFHILVLFRALMLKGYDIQISAIAGASVAALVVGKVVLIADAIPIINRFPDKPLMYNVVWKTVVYMLAAFIVHYLEHLVPRWYRAGSLVVANRQLLDEVIWPHFWAIQLWLIILFFVYCMLRELVRVLGTREAIQIFFGTPVHPRPPE